MAKSPFDKTTIYHSALVKETQDNGPLEITPLCSEPEPSKFDKRKLQVAFKCFGDTHYYVVENDACGDALSGHKGKTISIVASGREESAEIEVQGGSSRREERHDERRGNDRNERSERGHDRERDNRSQERGHGDREQSHRKSPEEKEAEERKTFSSAKVFAARAGVLMDICLHVARGLADKHLANPLEGPALEDIRTLATTLFIESKSVTDINKLPVKWLDKQQTQQPASREPQQRREEPPPREEPREERQRHQDPPPNDDAAEDDIPF